MLSKIEWPNFLFILFITLTASVGVLYLLEPGHFHPFTLALALLMLILTGLGITVGYHRLFSHKSYRANNFLKIILLLLGGAAFEGSAREWCCAHRKHHRFVDRQGDPYNINKGFWYAHVGWVILKADQSDESNIPDLMQDRLVRFQDRFYLPLSILISVLIPTGIAATWGDLIGGFLVASCLRIFLNLNFTFFINSYCHYFGRQTYSDRHTARDSWLISFFTYGEGYHNFHHSFETDYRNGIRYYQWDPSKWFIKLCSYVGLVSHLKKAQPHKILEMRLLMDTKRVKKNLIQYNISFDDWNKRLLAFKDHMTEIHHRLYELKKEYKDLKKRKIDSVLDHVERLQLEIKTNKKEFKEAFRLWTAVMNGKLSISSLPLPA